MSLSRLLLREAKCARNQTDPLLKTGQNFRVAQHSAACLISRTSRKFHITPVLKQLHWLPLDLRARYKMTLVYKTLNSATAPIYLKEILYKNTCRFTMSTTSGKLDILRTKRKVGDRSFAAYGPRVWNNLPASLRAWIL